MHRILLLATAFIWSFATAWGQADNDIKILGLVQNLETAWNSKNPDQYANNFCAKHDFIVWNGMYSPNITKEANKNGHKFLFAEQEYKDTNIKYVIDKIRYLSDSIALVHVLGSLYEKNKKPLSYPTLIQTWVVLKEDQTWKIKSFHSSDIEYDIFIQEEPCPGIPTSEEEKVTYAKEFFKSYTGNTN